jgi:hypothetical protein
LDRSSGVSDGYPSNAQGEFVVVRRTASSAAKSAHAPFGKYDTKITAANGGNHSPRQTRKAWAWIDECSAEHTAARLYHLVFVMADSEFGREFTAYHIHKSVLKRLMQQLRRKGIEASYQAAREIDDEKGDHLHAFVCVESFAKRPSAVLNRKPEDWLVKFAAAQGVKVYINEPRDPMHNGKTFMRLPASKPEKIADAKKWVSYLFKKRSKPDHGEIYSASRRIDHLEPA